MRIVLIGDVHVYVLAVWPWELLSKRMLGQVNLWLNRRRVFDLRRLPSLAGRIASIKPDAVLCSGDLTTTAHPREFRRVMHTLGEVFAAHPTFIVPGNHDRYTFASKRRRLFERGFGGHTSEAWPHHRTLAPGVELIGLDATRPNWLNASGALGEPQIVRLREMLAALPRAHRVIVLCHYPIGSPPGHHVESFGHRLTDGDRLVEVLAAAPQRVLYLHGHVHSPWCWRLPEPASSVVAVNAGAPIMADGDHPAGQGFWEIELTGRGVEPLRLTHHVPTVDGRWRVFPVHEPAEPGTAADLR